MRRELYPETGNNFEYLVKKGAIIRIGEIPVIVLDSFRFKTNNASIIGEQRQSGLIKANKWNYKKNP